MRIFILVIYIVSSLTGLAQTLEIWPMANEGVMIKVGEQQVIIDGLFKSTYPQFASTPASIYEKLQNSIAPFNMVELILASHKHSDHFTVPEIARVLKGADQTQLYVNEEMAEEMRSSPMWTMISKRVTEFPYAEETVYVRGDIKVRTFPILHARKKPSEMKNTAHVITIDGFNIMHVGDATHGQQDLVDLNVSELDLDVLILPFWFVRDQFGQSFVEKNLPARKYFINHIPPAQLKNVIDLLGDQPDMIVMGKEVFRFEK
ncbi:MAG: MBL fold metallo-hydrolase [Cyclobacteriaceae bacterium]